MTLTKTAFGTYDVNVISGGRRYTIGQVSKQLINGRVWWRARFPGGRSRAFDDLHRLRRDAVNVLTENDKEANR